MVVLSLTLLTSGCESTKIIVLYPQLSFPIYLEPRTEYLEESDEVVMSLNHYEEIMQYKLKVDKTKEIYEQTVELYKELEKQLRE